MNFVVLLKMVPLNVVLQKMFLLMMVLKDFPPDDGPHEHGPPEDVNPEDAVIQDLSWFMELLNRSTLDPSQSLPDLDPGLLRSCSGGCVLRLDYSV